LKGTLHEMEDRSVHASVHLAIKLSVSVQYNVATM